MEKEMKDLDLFFIKAVDHDMILLARYGSYQWISYEEFKKNGGDVVFMNDKNVREFLEINERGYDEYFCQALNIKLFSYELECWIL